MSLNILPARVAIGRATDENGKQYDVFATVEFSRMLETLLERIGGTDGNSTADIEALAAQALVPSPGAAAAQELPDLSPEIQMMRQEISALRRQVQYLVQAAQEPASVARDKSAEAASYATVGTPAMLDWSRPGQIGSRKPNTGVFTLLGAGAGTLAAPSFYLNNEKTTGLYRIAANRWGMSISGVKLLDMAAVRLDITGALTASLTARFGSPTTYSASFDYTVPGDIAGEFANRSPTGYGYRIVGGNAGNYALLVTDYSGASIASFTGTGLTVIGRFGCNGQAAQPAYVMSPTVSTAPATNVTPYGFSTQAQADALVQNVFQLVSAGKANGTLS